MSDRIEMSFRLPGLPLEEAGPRLALALSALADVDAMRSDTAASWEAVGPVELGRMRSLQLRTGRGRIDLNDQQRRGTSGFWPLDRDGDVLERLVDATRALVQLSDDPLVTVGFRDVRGLCSPRPPLAEWNVIVGCSKTRVEATYRSLDGFLAGFESTEDVASNVVCTRALAVDDVAGALFEPNWHLARETTGRSKIPVEIEPTSSGEAALVEAQSDRLHWIGYDEKTCTHALRAELTGGQHLSARDVARVARWLWDEEDDKGREVEHVEVVFDDARAARREQQPLLSAGTTVRVG